jgi:hypothetical protein
VATVRRPGDIVAAAVAVAVVLLGACGAGDSRTESTRGPSVPSPRIGPLTPRDPSRISPDQAAAIDKLADTASPLAPEDHSMHHGHEQSGPQTTVELRPSDMSRLKAQWQEARAAVPRLDTPEEAAAAGYTKAALQVPGIGTHWVNWTLIDAPFDPARPAMLLFDERGKSPVLVGFSYWLLSSTEPQGFAGGNDVWHRHTNLCVVNGWVDREQVESPAACAGRVLSGSDLWMLHAWIVPGWENRWGDFAVHNPALCPKPAGTPDILRCPTV